MNTGTKTLGLCILGATVLTPALLTPAALGQTRYRLSLVGTDLSPPGYPWKWATAINDAGTIAIYNDGDAVYLERPGGTASVPWSTLPGWRDAFQPTSIDINENVVVRTERGSRNPIVFHAGVGTDLAHACDARGWSWDINDAGRVVTSNRLEFPACTGNDPTQLGSIWTASGSRTYLPPFVAGAVAVPDSINNAGQICGAVDGRLVVWEQSGGAWSITHDIMDLGGPIDWEHCGFSFVCGPSSRINDHGMIVALDTSNELTTYDVPTSTLQNVGQPSFAVLNTITGFNNQGTAIGLDWIWNVSSGFVNPYDVINVPDGGVLETVRLRDINNAGVIVGDAVIATSFGRSFHAIRLDPVFPYYVVDLNLGLDYREHGSINDFGFVVGTLTEADGREGAFEWGEDGQQDKMDAPFEDGDSAAFDINDHGWAVGEYAIDEQSTGAFLYHVDAAHFIEIPSLGGDYTSARALNKDNIVVGVATDEQGARRAFRFDGEAIEDLGTLGGFNAEAVTINAAGHIAGTADLPSGAQRAFIVGDDGKITDLGTLGGDYSAAWGMNDLGDVVGTSLLDDETGVTSAFIWSAHDGMRALHAPGGALSARASAINNAGQAVGTAFLENETQVALFWDGGSAPIDLNTWLPDEDIESWHLLTAFDINENGVIVGLGLHGGTKKVFRMTPLSQ